MRECNAFLNIWQLAINRKADVPRRVSRGVRPCGPLASGAEAGLETEEARGSPPLKSLSPAPNLPQVGKRASIRLLFGLVLHNGLITGSNVGAERKQTLHWKCYSALDMPVD